MPESSTPDKTVIAKAFNEWMRRYIEEPERYQREFQSVAEFVKEDATGEEPTYGKACAEYLEQLMKEVA